MVGVGVSNHTNITVAEDELEHLGNSESECCTCLVTCRNVTTIASWVLKKDSESGGYTVLP